MNKKLKTTELNRLSNDDFKETKKIPLIVVLDNIRSMHNIGSVFRTSDAFLVESIELCGYTAKPPHKDIQKTALGATDTVTWTHHEDTVTCVETLKERGYKVYAIEQTEKSTLIQDITFDVNEKVAIIMGNEVKGVQQKVIDICDGSIEIPQFGTKHSLNVSVCSGILIWEIAKKLMPIK
jgi:23S rRNA (guanosine2251-2'-O)-methyltransferase